MGKEKKNPLNVVMNFTVKKTGFMDFDGLFAAIRPWFKTYDYDVIEKSHSEKKTATGGYMESIWKGTRKVTYYVKYILTVELFLRDLGEVEVAMPDGSKEKKQKGKLELVFNAKMEKNYLKTFSDTAGSLSNFLKFIYERFIAHNMLENHEKKLHRETMELKDALSKFLG